LRHPKVKNVAEMAIGSGNPWKMNHAKALNWNTKWCQKYAVIQTEPLYHRRKSYWFFNSDKHLCWSIDGP